MPASVGAGSGLVAVVGCPSPVAEGEGSGAGAGGDSGAGAVCANAPAQSDEIKNDVEASKGRRNATEAPCPDVGKLPRRHLQQSIRTDWVGGVESQIPNSCSRTSPAELE